MIDAHPIRLRPSASRIHPDTSAHTHFSIPCNNQTSLTLHGVTLMKHSLIALAVALAACTSAAATTTQTIAKKPIAAKKASVKKTAAKTKKTSKTVKPAPQPVVVHQAPATVAGAAGEFPVFVGDMRCDEGMAHVAAQGDEFTLKIPGGRQYTMRRMPTTTGVVRLEEASRNAYWLQSGNKSMLIDLRAGGRVADGCRNAIQQAREDELKLRPTAGLLQ